MQDTKVGRVTITAQGVTLTGEIISANDYGRKSQVPGESKTDWYVEFRQDNGRYGYWKQGMDGGRVVFHCDDAKPSKASQSIYNEVSELRNNLSNRLFDADNNFIGDAASKIAYDKLDLLCTELIEYSWVAE